MVKTSVIIPVYNTEDYLSDCLESVLRQTQKEWEIIAVDDGSTDHSLEILRVYENKHTNIHVYSQKNMRQGAARNIGLKYAKGDYVYFLDSDDTIDIEMLEECHACATNNQLDLVLFDSKVFFDGEFPIDFHADGFDRREIISDINRIYTGVDFLGCYMEKQPDTVSPCMMYLSKKFVLDNKLMFMPNVFYEDEEFRFNLMQKALRIMYQPKLYYNRRYRNNSTMTVCFNLERNRNLSKVICQMIKDVEDNTSKILKRYIEIKMWMLLDRCKLMNDKESVEELIKDIQQLVHQYWTRFDMPYDIEDIKFRIYFTDYLQTIFKKYDWSMEQEIANRQRMILLGKIPMGNRGEKIGIYGREDLVDRLLCGYRKEYGEVYADIYRLVKRKRESDEIGIDSVQNIDLNYILLVSGDEQTAVLDYLKHSVTTNTRILCLGDEDGNFLF